MVNFHMQSKEYSKTAKRLPRCLCRVIIPILLLLVTVFLLAVAGNQTMRITKNDNGREIDVSRGNLIEVSLDSQGTTGYLWTFESIDPDYIEVMREESAVASAPGLTGGAVIHTWLLRLKKEGLTEIRMSYKRPWEGKDKAADTFTVRLRILP
jgi:predicted secreted protein